MRSIPVVDAKSVAMAQSYDGIADMLLLDSHRPGDVQIGALGVTHSWQIDRAIVESVGIPVIIAGGLGPDNVIDAITAVRPAGGRFKDQDGQRRWQPHQRFAKGETICRSSEIAALNTQATR
jgi:phosphoribosylanthranilate isomerase